jgi:hypothetical protein
MPAFSGASNNCQRRLLKNSIHPPVTNNCTSWIIVRHEVYSMSKQKLAEWKLFYNCHITVTDTIPSAEMVNQEIFYMVAIILLSSQHQWNYCHKIVSHKILRFVLVIFRWCQTSKVEYAWNILCNSFTDWKTCGALAALAILIRSLIAVLIIIGGIMKTNTVRQLTAVRQMSGGRLGWSWREFLFVAGKHWADLEEH